MPSLKDVRVKISGVGKTKQITKAMNMVASAKLRGAQSRMEKFRAFADRFRAMLHNIAGGEHELTHPLLTPHESVRTVGIVLATSDRGLCGGFNANLINAAMKLAKEKQAQGINVVFYCVGRKGRDAARKGGYTIARDLAGHMGVLDFQLADRLGFDLIDAYLKHEIDEAVLVFGEFFSLLRQTPSIRNLLPIRPEEHAPEEPQEAKEYIYEPSGDTLMQTLLPRVVKAQLYRGLLDTSTSENAARMTAMDNATRNCDDLIQSLTKLFNKTRQAAITSDLIDIVGGAEALKG